MVARDSKAGLVERAFKPCRLNFKTFAVPPNQALNRYTPVREISKIHVRHN
jgi:hypothetical protein